MAMTHAATSPPRVGIPLNGRQAEVLALVEAAGGPLSTSEVRVRLNQHRAEPLVAEQV